MMLRMLTLNVVILAGTLAACTVQTGDTDSGGETAGESGGTGGEPTEGPGTDGPCACIDPEQYARESYVCAEPSCGVVYVECDQTTEEEAAACFGDGHLVELDEAALDCSLDLLISGAEGMVEWHILDQGDGASGYSGAFVRVAGGTALTRSYGGLDLGSNEGPAGFVALKPASYFSGCKAMPDAQDRFRCLIEWSDEEPKADCDPADMHSEEF